MTTVHAMTATQLTVDGPSRGGKDVQRLPFESLSLQAPLSHRIGGEADALPRTSFHPQPGQLRLGQKLRAVCLCKLVDWYSSSSSSSSIEAVGKVIPALNGHGPTAVRSACTVHV